MQQANPDPFGAYTPQQEDPSTIFSVLPTTSILSTLTNGSPRQTPTRSNSLATITPSPLAGPSTSTTSATTAAAAAEVSTSTAQAEPSKASNKKDQWSTSLAAISEYAKANGNGDAATEIGGDHLTESSGEGKTESEEGQSRSARSSSGPPVEGGSNTWAS